MKTTTTDRYGFQRALDMGRTLLSTAVQRTEPHPLGLLLFDDRRPRVWVARTRLSHSRGLGELGDLFRYVRG